MIGTTDPYRAVILQLQPALAYPRLIERIYMLWRTALVPFPLVHAHHLPALHADSPIAQEIRRISKYHVKLEIKLSQQFNAITMKKRKSTVRRFEIRINHCHLAQVILI